MLATPESLASGELTPVDLEFESMAARCSARQDGGFGVRTSVEASTRTAAEFVARPGGEAVAEAHRKLAEECTSPSCAACARWPTRPRPRTRTQPQGSLQRGGPGGPTPDTWARSGPTDGSSLTNSMLAQSSACSRSRSPR
jgi:hypothetical protein